MSTSRRIKVIKALEMPLPIHEVAEISNIDELITMKKQINKKVDELLQSKENKYIQTEDNFLEYKKANELLIQNKIKFLSKEKCNLQNTLSKEKLVLKENKEKNKIVKENLDITKKKEDDFLIKKLNTERDYATFNLFCTTFGLRWDYSSSDNELKGIFMINNELTPFSLKKSENKKHVSCLWDMIYVMDK
nr:uncharacterized protein LOC105850809 [Hydra vulgaris]XP_047126296.1 uncharacterized protein LOC105850809 [Hydra vulgaris]XP_047126297.1 uncharacterized protein LOC105850809 [Hydra vulgaris]